MTPPVFLALSQHVETATLLGPPPIRAFPAGKAPPGVPYSYVTWVLVVGIPENTLSGTPEFDAETVQIDAWAEDYDKAKTLGAACRKAIEPFGYVTSFGIPQPDPDTGAYRVTIEAEFIVPPQGGNVIVES